VLSAPGSETGNGGTRTLPDADSGVIPPGANQPMAKGSRAAGATPRGDPHAGDDPTAGDHRPSGAPRAGASKRPKCMRWMRRARSTQESVFGPGRDQPAARLQKTEKPPTNGLVSRATTRGSSSASADSDGRRPVAAPSIRADRRLDDLTGARRTEMEAAGTSLPSVRAAAVKRDRFPNVALYQLPMCGSRHCQNGERARARSSDTTDRRSQEIAPRRFYVVENLRVARVVQLAITTHRYLPDSLHSHCWTREELFRIIPVPNSVENRRVT
jgi:hypothetical protein